MVLYLEKERGTPGVRLIENLFYQKWCYFCLNPLTNTEYNTIIRYLANIVKRSWLCLDLN